MNELLLGPLPVPSPRELVLFNRLVGMLFGLDRHDPLMMGGAAARLALVAVAAETFGAGSTSNPHITRFGTAAGTTV